MKKKNKFFVIILSMFLVAFINFTNVSAEPYNVTIEGEGNSFVTGESYAEDIIFTGYNVRDDKYYLNYDLVTEKTVTTTADFNYYIEIYNDSSSLIGNDGSYEVPTTGTTTEGADSDTLSVTNKEIELSGALTAEHRVTITVKSVEIN